MKYDFGNRKPDGYLLQQKLSGKPYAKWRTFDADSTPKHLESRMEELKKIDAERTANPDRPQVPQREFRVVPFMIIDGN